MNFKTGWRFNGQDWNWKFQTQPQTHPLLFSHFLANEQRCSRVKLDTATKTSDKSYLPIPLIGNSLSSAPSAVWLLFLSQSAASRTQRYTRFQSPKAGSTESRRAERQLSRRRLPKKERPFLIPRWPVGAANLIHLHAVKKCHRRIKRRRRYLKEVLAGVGVVVGWGEGREDA